MKERPQEDDIYAAVSAQRALLGVVTPNLRAVTIMPNTLSKTLKFVFFMTKLFPKKYGIWLVLQLQKFQQISLNLT